MIQDSPRKGPSTPIETSYFDADNVSRLEAPRSPPAMLAATPTMDQQEQWYLRLARKWYVIRWRLSRTILAKPLPIWTHQIQFTWGDIFITTPIFLGVIAWSAASTSQHDVGGTGSPAAIAALATFAFAIRNNFILTMAGLPFERAIAYHRMLGRVAWLLSALHGLAYLLNKNNEDDEFDQTTVVTGIVMFAAFTILVAFALEFVRRRFYDVFLRLHWIAFIVIVVAGVIHGAAVILVGFVPWVVDVVFRMYWRRRQYNADDHVIHASQVSVQRVSKDVIRVQFPRVRDDTTKEFKFKAGQYIFLCFPDVAMFEWHPFTIASAPHEPLVTAYIRPLGDWTKKLATLSELHTITTMFVDGPYGAPSIEMDHYSHFVFVSGGIGVTPMLSFANTLFYESLVARSRQVPLEKAHFVWSVRDREIVKAILADNVNLHSTAPPQSWLPHGLVSRGSSNSDEDTFFAQIFLTREQQDMTHPVDQQFVQCLQYNQRPDLENTLRDVGRHALRLGHQRVGVLACGPKVMIEETIAASGRVRKELGSVSFDVHHEVFDF